MKRLLIFLLLPLLLAGCSRPPVTGTEPSAAPTVPEPSGLYDPESELEDVTGGTVKCYRLDDNTYSRILPLGNDLLLVSRNNTRLTLVTGSNLVPVVEKELSFHVQHIQTGSEGVAYWDEQNRSMVFLSNTLREISRLQLPQDLTGWPWLSPGWESLYYCTESGLRRLELDSGISLLVTAQNSSNQSVTGVFLNGSVVCCELIDPNGTVLTRMISAANGEILWEGTALRELTSAGENWFARVDQAVVQELVFGNGDTARNLWPKSTFDGILSVPEQNAILTYRDAAWGNRINYYDLTTGRCSASVRLKGIRQLRDLCPDAAGEGLWLLAQNASSGTDVICHWTPSASPTGDTTDYTQPHYTRDNPDTQSLQSLQEQLQSLRSTHAIALLIGESAGTVPEGLSVETEYLAPVFQRYIPVIKGLLDQFPEDLFAKAAQRTPSGLIHIALVRSLEGQVPDMPALHFRQDGEIYLVLQLDENLQQNFYHSVSHMIETRLLSTCAALYDWDKLNPEGFSYDNDYIKNLDRDGSQYLQGENRGFIDTFSMSFAREDRARILEYACMPGNEELFQCRILQLKLQMLCAGIREAFAPEGNFFIWEQYLSAAE